MGLRKLEDWLRLWVDSLKKVELNFKRKNIRISLNATVEKYYNGQQAHSALPNRTVHFPPLLKSASA